MSAEKTGDLGDLLGPCLVAVVIVAFVAGFIAFLLWSHSEDYRLVSDPVNGCVVVTHSTKPSWTFHQTRSHATYCLDGGQR